MKKRNKKYIKRIIITAILIAILEISNYYKDDILKTTSAYKTEENYEYYSSDDIPEYSGKKYITLNNNVPNFSEDELIVDEYEAYSELDDLGRCGSAIANISKYLMPTEKRGSIGSVKPSGWHTVKYNIVDGKYLYNRCHLIGYQLTGENANEENLITCTRQMNTEGMLEFENKIAQYIKETNNHVLYRVTPIFKDNNLLASGVVMEAKSIEDNGEGISFNVFVYNVQDGIEINYEDGSSKLLNSN